VRSSQWVSSACSPKIGVVRQYEHGPDGQFHDGFLMDLLRGELTAD
jgi:hypothetical protein